MKKNKDLEISLQNPILIYKNLEYNYSDKDKILLALYILYENGNITYPKLLGQIRALNKGTLLKRKNTYHCSINDKWYDCESMVSIFDEIIYNLPKYSYIKEINLDSFVKILMLQNNKGYNYSLNYLIVNYIYPLLDKWNSNNDYKLYFAEYIGYMDSDWNNIRKDKYVDECWCCGAGNTTYSTNMSYNREFIAEYFHQFKKGNLSKIPTL